MLTRARRLASGRVCARMAGMKMLFDFFPVLVFFAVYKLYDIYAATAALIATSLVQTLAFRLRHGRFERMHVITLALVALLGGATLALHDEAFIKWKPTIVNWLFGAAFLLSQWIGERNLVRRMLADKIELPEAAWTRLNAAWGLFFVAMGCLNLWVAFSFDTETWVNFKLFGLMGLTLAFIVAQGLWLARFVRA